MKIVKSVLAVIIIVGLISSMVTRIAIAGEPTYWHSITLYSLLVFSAAWIARLLIALITDENKARGFACIIVFCLLFVLDFSLGRLFPEYIEASNSSRLLRVIGLYVIAVIAFSGIANLIYRLYKLRKPERQESVSLEN